MILTALLWMAATGAFLLYVPLLPLMVVMFFLFGLALMFILGVETGRRVTDAPELLTAEEPHHTSTANRNSLTNWDWKSVRSAAYSKISSLFSEGR